MTITMNDLTVNFGHLDPDTLLSDWSWLIGPTKRPILLTAIGNAFVQDTQDGSIHLLLAGQAELLSVAGSYEEFRGYLNDKQFVMDNFVVGMILALRNAGIMLEAGQIYGFKIPPLVGGQYTVENIEATDIAVHFSFLGQIAGKAKDLPPDTKIERFQIS